MVEHTLDYGVISAARRCHLLLPALIIKSAEIDFLFDAVTAPWIASRRISAEIGGARWRD